jgi:membrane protease YdiL (CAAX protease family)
MNWIKEKSWDIKKAITFVIIFFLIHVVATVLFTSLGSLLKIDISNGISEALTFWIVLYITFIRKEGKFSFEKNLKLKDVIVSLILFLSFKLIYSGTIDNLVDYFIKSQNINIDTSEFLNLHFLDYFLISIHAPLTEEIFFRGIILEKFLGKYSYKKAIVLSSIIFSIAHIGIRAPHALFIGIFIAFIYYKYKSLPLCILIHSINNAYLLLGIAIYKTFEINILFWDINLLVDLIGGFILLIIGLIIYKK